MAKRCSQRRGCSYPRASWWKDALGVNWYGSGGSEEETIDDNVTDPFIYGYAAHGFTLSVFEGTFTAVPSSFVYQWNRDGIAIGGATSRTYVVQAADIDTTLTCTVTPQGRTAYTTAGFDIALPDWSTAGSLELLLESYGLVTNTNNSFGIVNGSSQLTTWKSLAPGPTGRDFTNNGTAPNLTATGVAGAGGTMRHATAATWNFAHFNATAANHKVTLRVVCAPGTSSNPDAAYGLIGNAGFSGANKGFSFVFDDRVSQPRSNAARWVTSQGSGNFTFNNTQNEVMIPNQKHLYTVEVELSTVPNTYKYRIYRDAHLQTSQVVYSTTAMQTTPSFALELLGAGNGVFPYAGEVQAYSLQSTIDSQDTRLAIDLGLINRYQITPSTTVPTSDATQTLDIYDVYQETLGDYYLSANYDAHPWKPHYHLRTFTDGHDHTVSIVKKISQQKSSNYGWSYATKTTQLDPPGDISVQDLAAGFALHGRHNRFIDTHGINGAGTNWAAPHAEIYQFSDDIGATVTDVDLTSLMPDDGLNTWRNFSQVVQSGNYILQCFYKYTDEGDITQSAVYMFKIHINADPTVLSNWQVKTVRPKGNGLFSEAAMADLGDGFVLLMLRDEVTPEYERWVSTDYGDTYSFVQEESLGESFLFAAPGRLEVAYIENTPCVAFYLTDRNVPNLKRIWATVASIKAGGAFVSGSKELLLQNTRRVHYLTALHLVGNFNCIILSAYEKNPLNLSDNQLSTMIPPSTNYSTVRTALGL